MRMRIKNFTLLFLMGLFGLFTTNLFAQNDASIDPANVRYWIGEGENEVVFVINWNEPDTALAWGFRFGTENVTVKEMMLEIRDTDPRFSFDYSEEYNFVNDIRFYDGVLDLHLSAGGYFMYNVNGTMSNEYFNAQLVVNGDYVKWGDTNCGTMIDPENWIYVWEKEITAVYAYALEAMIDPSEIIYWIGEGANEVIFAVNFADHEDVCFAWGYRFATESVTIKEMMQAIADEDLRFAFTDAPSSYGGFMLTELTFVNDDVVYNLQGYNAMYNVNGVASWYTFDEQTVVGGDFVKWGDYNIGTEIASWTYVWETPVTPVSVYNTSVSEVGSALSVYPNPATSYTMLEGELSGATVTVSDLQGRMIRSFVVDNNEAVRIETSGYQAGIYFVTVSKATSCQTVKLSVK